MSYNTYAVEHDILERANGDDYVMYTWENMANIAKVVDVYDGDTCDVLVVIRGEVERHRVRMMGYDSPEMKPALSDPQRDMKKLTAKAAKSRLIELVLNKIVYFVCHGDDKYGRKLLTMFFDAARQKSINQQMIDEGHGYPYSGGTKQVTL